MSAREEDNHVRVSKKPEGMIVTKIECWNCGGDMVWQGKRKRVMSPTPRIKGGFQWREWVCEECGSIIRTGGFLQE
jgi:predicted RNA-binding Zn-ribbon protein involved in translation (DUF1610 family)